MGKFDTAKWIVGRRSKVFKKVDPSDLKTKMKGTWYLRSWFEKAIFLFGGIMLPVIAFWGIGKLINLIKG